MLTIGIIDEYPVLRMGLNVVLKKEFDGVVILESTGIKAFFQHFPEELPDIIIVGDSVVKRIKLIGCLQNWYKHSKIVIYDEERLNMIIYLQAGANGFIGKHAPISELVTGIKCVLDGKVYLNQDIVVELLMGLSLNVKSSPRQISDLSVLTRREYEIAKYLRNGLSTSCIAQKLSRKSSTISTIKRNIYSKLNITTIVELGAFFIIPLIYAVYC